MTTGQGARKTTEPLAGALSPTPLACRSTDPAAPSVTLQSVTRHLGAFLLVPNESAHVLERLARGEITVEEALQMLGPEP